MDDILVASNSVEDVMKVKNELVKEFNINDLGVASRILGIDIRIDRKQSRLYVSRETYLKKILDKFGMSNSKSILTPTSPQYKMSTTQSPNTEVERAYKSNIPYSSILGSLMYVMVYTRPDITY